jgi:8-oxo-dGTP diphosphatase
MTRERPIVVLTALDLEYQAVRRHLSRPRLHRHPAGTRFEVGRLDGGEALLVLGLVGKGNHPAAVLAERAISEFEPAAVMFAGIAGALWDDIGLGDVVVATHVYAYHGGTSEDDGFKARPRVWEASHASDQIARHLHRTGAWTRYLPPGTAVPTVRFGPIAAGEVVQNSRISAHARWVRRTYNDALAIEMEAAGIAQAAHLNHALPTAVVRGISDRADGTKEATDGRGWQATAAANAAAFAVALADELARERGTGREDGAARAAGRRERAAMTGNVLNLAQDNARVTMQVGVVYGDVTIGRDAGAGPDLRARLADLRDRLEKARRNREIDEATYAAAAEELSVASGSLAEGSGGDRERALLALKKLRGLLADSADLMPIVTAVIAAVTGAS